MLKDAIEGWDNKTSADIKTIYQNYFDTPDFQKDLLSALTHQNLQRGATWLLKHHFEHKGVLNEQEINEIFENLRQFDHWESKLHILQSIEHIMPRKNHQMTLEDFIRPCLESDNKMLRAWAYHGFYHLAKQFPEYKAEAETLLQNAASNEAASVKARIRNLR